MRTGSVRHGYRSPGTYLCIVCLFLLGSLFPFAVVHGEDGDAFTPGETSSGLPGSSPTLSEPRSLSFTSTSPKPCIGNEDVALIQDVPPWGAVPDHDPLGADAEELTVQGISYCVIPSSELESADLSPFQDIIIASVQPQGFYYNLFPYGTIHPRLVEYVERGGNLSANLTDCGRGLNGTWAGWQCVSTPTNSFSFIGGLKHVSFLSNANSIVDATHPIITGQFGGGNGGKIEDVTFRDDLDYWYYSSHGYFIDLPDGTRTILADQFGRPVMVEYPYGKGKVIATLTTIEWRYNARPIMPFENKKLLANEVGYQKSLTDLTLHVPYFDQQDTEWGKEEYDSASNWSSPAAPTIGRWGCAMTSVAMVLRYNGITELPACSDNKCPELVGQDLNPGTLNAWLKKEPGGYGYEGNINWWTIETLSKNAGTRLKHDIGTTWKDLEDEIKNQIPGILDLLNVQHFVVAKGILTSKSTFALNDPGYYYSKDLLGYDNKFRLFHMYRKRTADLNGILVTVSPHAEFQVTKVQTVKPVSAFALQSKLNEDNKDFTYYLEPGLDDDGGSGVTSGQGTQIGHLDNPDAGSYTVTVNGTGEALHIAFYSYDREGRPNIFYDTRKIAKGSQLTYTIVYDPDNRQQFSVQLPIKIDIKPDSPVNPITCNDKNGVIPVAVLSDENFDAREVGSTTLTFEGASVARAGNAGKLQEHEEDVNGDGLVDKVFHFRQSDAALTCSSTDGMLEGKLSNGLTVIGTDSIRIVGQKKGK